MFIIVRRFASDFVPSDAEQDAAQLTIFRLLIRNSMGLHKGASAASYTGAPSHYLTRPNEALKYAEHAGATGLSASDDLVGGQWFKTGAENFYNSGFEIVGGWWQGRPLTSGNRLSTS